MEKAISYICTQLIQNSKDRKAILKKNKHFIAHRDEFGEAYAIPFASASMSVSASGCMEPILDLNYNWSYL